MRRVAFSQFTSLFVWLIVLSPPFPSDLHAATEIGVVELEGESFTEDPAASRRLFSLIEKAGTGKGGEILEIEGGVFDPDNERAIEKSFRLATETYDLLDRKKLPLRYDIYLSATRVGKGEVKQKARVRLTIHADRFEKVGVGRMIPSSPVGSSTPPVAPRPQPEPPPPPPVSVVVDPSGSGSVQTPVTGRQKQLSAEEIRELDERVTRDQSRRAQELIERAKAKAAERQRRRALEEKRQAERLEAERREAERSARDTKGTGSREVSP